MSENTDDGNTAQIPSGKGKPPTVDKGNGAASETQEARPVVEELPEEPSNVASLVRPAAAAEKFKKFGAMRQDPGTSLVPVRKRLTAIPPRQPNSEWFIRTSTLPGHSGVLPLFWDKGGDGHPYLIDEAVHDYFGDKVQNNHCVLSCTRQKMFFLWCSPLENRDGEWNSWHASAYDMKGFAAAAWIRVVSNKQLGGYEVVDFELRPGKSPPPDPEWPDIAWENIVLLAFRRHLVEVETHPLIIRRAGG